MARYTDHDLLAAEALRICESVRELGPLQTYNHLAAQCQRDPERMAQMLMCLATWVPYDEEPVGGLVARAEAIVDGRIRAAGSRTAS